MMESSKIPNTIGDVSKAFDCFHGQEVSEVCRFHGDSLSFPLVFYQETSITPYSDAVQTHSKINKVKRPLNAFMVWSKEERKKMCDADPELHHAMISKLLGQRWGQLTNDEKQVYKDEADRLRDLHAREYPDYKFQPRKKVKRFPPFVEEYAMKPATKIKPQLDCANSFQATQPKPTSSNESDCANNFKVTYQRKPNSSHTFCLPSNWEKCYSRPSSNFRQIFINSKPSELIAEINDDGNSSMLIVNAAEQTVHPLSHERVLLLIPYEASSGEKSNQSTERVVVGKILNCDSNRTQFPSIVSVCHSSNIQDDMNLDIPQEELNDDTCSVPVFGEFCDSLCHSSTSNDLQDENAVQFPTPVCTTNRLDNMIEDLQDGLNLHIKQEPPTVDVVPSVARANRSEIKESCSDRNESNRQLTETLKNLLYKIEPEDNADDFSYVTVVMPVSDKKSTL